MTVQQQGSFFELVKVLIRDVQPDWSERKVESAAADVVLEVRRTGVPVPPVLEADDPYVRGYEEGRRQAGQEIRAASSQLDRMMIRVYIRCAEIAERGARVAGRRR